MLFGIRKGKERLKTFSSLRFDVPELTWTAPCLHFVYVSYIDHAGYAGRDTGNREASSGDRSPGVPLLGIQSLKRSLTCWKRKQSKSMLYLKKLSFSDKSVQLKV